MEYGVPALVRMWDLVVQTRLVPFSWPWQEEVRALTAPIFVVTDASSSGWGYILGTWTNQRFFPTKVERGVWGNDDTRHIFLKELDAALRGLRAVEGTGDVIMVGDNVAVSWALKQGFTRNLVGMGMLQTAETRRIRSVITVISADNPADSPSRGEEVQPERMAKLESVLRGAELGEVRASEPRAAWSPDEQARQIRHEGPLDEIDSSVSGDEDALEDISLA